MYCHRKIKFGIFCDGKELQPLDLEIIGQDKLPREGLRLVFVLEAGENLRGFVFTQFYDFFGSDFAVIDFLPDVEGAAVFLVVATVV